MNPYAHLKAKYCKSCYTDTHHYDRDCNLAEPFYMIWVKKNPDTNELQGDECYRCFAVRRAYYTNTFKDLQDARSNDTNQDEHFLMLRRDKVSKYVMVVRFHYAFIYLLFFI